MKAIKITTDNEISVIDIQEPSLKGMQEQVGGFIEVVRPWGLYNLDTQYKKSLCMIVNEEGRLIGLEHNLVGSVLYNDTPTQYDYDPIAGNILIMMEGFVDGEPDIIGLDDEQLKVIMAALKNKFKYLTEEEVNVYNS